MPKQPRWSILPTAMVLIAVIGLAILSIPATAAAEDLRVMSFNIRTANANDGPNDWDGNRKNLVEQTIRNFGPDLAGFQEDLLRQHNFLDGQFPAYEFVGRGAEGGDNGPFNTIMYRRNRFERLRGGNFWLSETPGTPGSESWGTAFPRMVTWLELRDLKNPDFTFVFMNTHWDHVSGTARLESATLMRQKINELASGIPVIVTGDFNADQGSNPYRRMRGLDDFDTVRNLQDTYRNIHNDGGSVGTAHGFDGTAGSGRIDWILHDNKFTTLDASIVRTSYDGAYPSDHFPVTAIIDPIPEPAGAAIVGLVSCGALLSRRRLASRSCSSPRPRRQVTRWP